MNFPETSSNLYPIVLKQDGDFAQKCFQTRPCKITFLVIGILFLGFASYFVAGILMPSVRSFVFLNALFSQQILILFASLMGVCGALSLAFAVAAIITSSKSTSALINDVATETDLTPLDSDGERDQTVEQLDSVFWAFDQNKEHRNVMEDTHIAVPLNLLKAISNVFLIAVMDGHNGDKVAKYIQQNIQTEMQSFLDGANLSEPASVFKAIEKGLQNLHMQAKDACQGEGGACIALCLIIQNRLYVANLGDVRVVFHDAQTKKSIRLSKDHKASDSGCAQEVKSAGGTVFLDAVLSENFESGVQVTRTLGDWHIKGLRIDPHCSIQELREGDSVVVASDGLWDVVAEETVTKTLEEGPENKREEKIKQLVKGARKSKDNITLGLYSHKTPLTSFY